MRGQAAIEYLVTYGWALIAILVVLGGLSYFGMLSPTKYLPARCDFGPQLECVDYELSGEFISGTQYNGLIRFQLRNNLGEDINISNIISTNGPQGEWRYFHEGSSSWLTTSSVLVEQGNMTPLLQYRVEPTDRLRLVDGERYMVTVVVSFFRSSPQGPEHNITGVIFSSSKPATAIS